MQRDLVSMLWVAQAFWTSVLICATDGVNVSILTWDTRCFFLEMPYWWERVHYELPFEFRKHNFNCWRCVWMGVIMLTHTCTNLLINNAIQKNIQSCVDNGKFTKNILIKNFREGKSRYEHHFNIGQKCTPKNCTKETSYRSRDPRKKHLISLEFQINTRIWILLEKSFIYSRNLTCSEAIVTQKFCVKQKYFVKPRM